MLFNSPIFLFIFLPIVVILFHCLSYVFKKNIFPKVLLICASLLFYAYFDYAYLLIILSSLIFNYFLGLYLVKSNSKKVFLYLGIIANLSLLGYYKYYDFFINNINSILDTQFELKNLLLPLAISFFTFQQISFLIDTFKGRCDNKGILDYGLFVTFFPQLIAGPIVHHSQMMGQFKNEQTYKFNGSNFVLGLSIFLIGLIKKVILADSLAQYCDPVFIAADKGMDISFIEGWLGSLAYTFQIYFDFSGYCDMAIGAAWFFNIKLPINFNSPYKSNNIQVFWRRWHITLSTWMRDNIYIPLGGNRKGEAIVLINVFITALISGIWHGAGWNFVLWGALHGGALITVRLWSKLNIQLPKILSILITFLFVHITWIFFRAFTFEGAFEIFKSLFSFSEFQIPLFIEFYQTDQYLFSAPKYFESVQGVYWIVISFIVAFFGVWSIDLAKKGMKFKDSAYYLGILAFVFLFIGFISMGSDYSAFIYYNF
jgi:alginate O-acetyltransferase complex protein AlgI